MSLLSSLSAHVMLVSDDVDDIGVKVLEDGTCFLDLAGGADITFEAKYGVLRSLLITALNELCVAAEKVGLHERGAA